MELYPAIDLYQGKAVRLRGGNFEDITVYSDHPAGIAQEWQAQGARWIHVVDLEGARGGKVVHAETLKTIRASVQCRIQFGGGLRCLQDIEAALSAGADRVILGTKALDKPFLTEALARFGSKLAVGLDVRAGKVQLEGWLKESSVNLGEALNVLKDLDVQMIIVTDITKDGMLAGPNFGQIEGVLKSSRARVILSGGVSSLEDIRKAGDLPQDHFEGVIIGKALYERKFTLAEAFQQIRPSVAGA